MDLNPNLGLRLPPPVDVHLPNQYVVEICQRDIQKAGTWLATQRPIGCHRNGMASASHESWRKAAANVSASSGAGHPHA
jgi:hypothetical protein